MTDTRPLGPTGARVRPARHRSSAALICAVAVLALLVAGCASGQGPAQPTAAPATSNGAPPAPPGAPAKEPATSSPATAAAAPQRPLARVFPAVDGPTCRATVPTDQLTNSSGAAPTEAYVCEFATVAPGAVAIFTQWADPAAAQSWYADTAALGPRLENFDIWQVSGVQQGALYTAQGPGGVVFSTGVYDGLPYAWEIHTATLDQSNQVFNQIQFLQRTTFGS